MNILFIHQNFPGQFRHIAQSLLQEGKHHVLCLCEAHAPGLAGVEKVIHKPGHKGTPGIHGYLAGVEEHVLRGQSVARALLSLNKHGYQPDVRINGVGVI